jgi:uncharacterized membrane protein (Fun14 family)
LALNSKIALLILGLLVGGVAGYATRPQAAEIKIGGTSIEFSDNKVSTNSSGALTSGQTQHIFLYAAIGGVIGLLVGFAVDRRA